MKKVSVFLLTATPILFTSCMERPRNWPYYNDNAEEHTLTLSHSSDQSSPAYTEAEQLHVQQLPNINTLKIHKGDQPAEITVTRANLLRSQSLQHEKKKAPLRRIPSARSDNHLNNKTIKHHEKKDCLRTIVPHEPDQDLMQKFYDNVYTCFLSIQNNNNYKWITNGNSLAYLIYDMNKIKEHGIDEDTMGKFAYDKTSFFSDIKAYTTLFFSFLKRYTLTTTKTGEALPINLNIQKSDLKEISDSSPRKSKKCKTYNLHHTTINFSTLKQQPAFISFAYALDDSMKHSTQIITHLISCLYAHPQATIPYYPKKLFLDINEFYNEFYTKAYTLLLIPGHIERLYEILTLIESTKPLNDAHYESKLGYSILNLDPTDTTIADVSQIWDAKRSTKNAKNRIALFCKVIGKYNLAREKKITPTLTQHQAYALCKDLRLAKPKSCQCTQLNKECYAFAEFKQLKDDLEKLMNADIESVQQQVTQLYQVQKQNTAIDYVKKGIL